MKCPKTIANLSVISNGTFLSSFISRITATEMLAEIGKMEAENKILKDVIWHLGSINEDELPELPDERFGVLFEASKVDIVRIYPRLVLNGLMYKESEK